VLGFPLTETAATHFRRIVIKIGMITDSLPDDSFDTMLATRHA
jgi:hypothetical protein